MRALFLNGSARTIQSAAMRLQSAMAGAKAADAEVLSEE